MKPSLVFVALLAATASLAAQNMVIYDDALKGSWQDWGWAAHNYANSSPTHTNSAHSISVTCNGYDAIYMHGDTFDARPYTNLVFWANGGASGGQKLSVAAVTYSDPDPVNQPWLDLAAPLPANTWTQIVVPLSALNVAYCPNMDGIWIGIDTGSAIPTFYLDDISLQAAAPAGPNPTNFLGVDLAANRHPISPLIYGVAFATSNDLKDLNFTLNRSGGNNESRYNWLINAHNLDFDWYFESVGNSPTNSGASADEFVADSKYGGAQAAITVPMIGWAPRLGPGRSTLASYNTNKYGPQKAADPWNPQFGDGFSSTNGNKAITSNDPNDANTPVDVNFQKGYVNHLVNKWGPSTNGGVSYYIMDNEHSLWQSTHQDIHPAGPAMQEIRNDIVAYASMVKSVDSNALVWGPEEWGWPGYFWSGYDQQWSGQNNNYNQNQYPDRGTNGGWDYAPWLLNQMRQYELTNHQRLLDFFTLHCYPQSGEFDNNNVTTSEQLTRNRSTRQLWDPAYLDPSWINNYIDLIPRMKNWVSTYYPGIKIGVTEYNWGAEPYMNGATAQADILGIFGREGLDLSTRWTTPTNIYPTYLALKIYRNYDGRKSTFGDTSVLATAPNPDNVSVFAAQRGSDAALTIMVVNKYLAGATPLVLNLTNFAAGGSAQVWQLNSSNTIARLPDIPVTGNAIRVSVANQSVTLFVIPATHALNFTPGSARKDGQFEFWINGQLGESFVLQSSADLSHWAPLATNSFTNSAFHVLLPTLAAATFYRAVTPE